MSEYGVGPETVGQRPLPKGCGNVGSREFVASLGIGIEAHVAV